MGLLIALSIEKAKRSDYYNMKILYIAPKYDYGKRDRGLSFEHNNFFDTFEKTGNEIIYFDYFEILRKIGKARMNETLYDVFTTEQPDLVFVFLFEFELDKRVISALSKSKNSITINWFADDHWRFDNFSRYWAPHFNWVITTDENALPKYQSIGYKNVILSQWACNHFMYKNLNLPRTIDVSFVGQAYGNRQGIVNAIRNAEISIYARGIGWPLGRATQDEMIEIFNRSKINLNLANASVDASISWMLPIDRVALYTPFVKRIWRKLHSTLTQGHSRPVMQIKGRNFEIPGTGGFILTDYVPGIEKYYEIGKDIVCYLDKTDLVAKIKYYLQNDNLRNKIAQNGYHATLDKHTYVHRLNEIFRVVGLNEKLPFEERRGKVIEIANRF